MLATESPGLAAAIVITTIRKYQTRVSPALARRFNIQCVYEPTCSEYMILAIAKYRAVRGVSFGLRRLARCRKGFGGVDYP